MHELAICQSLINQVEKIALEHQAISISLIVVGIGPLSGVEAQLLKSAFPIASAHSITENSKLIVQALPVKVKCNQCGCESEALPNKLICKQCGNWQTSLVSGDELLLISVELEKADSPENISTKIKHS